ncbi:helix-turn-helix domain-containing protein [Arcticibacter eurypsychrophilus]|uniref:helix-turn-helix domain-containing protein n=1 Tax=Arcticibacter eurypsychrophilus TaxID=1434752 RepID=UPI00084D2E2A|nr:helix-turn-helix domain-containing protein [Arcticibacter eurypsychrophilus]
MIYLNGWVLPGALFSFVLVALIFIVKKSNNYLSRTFLGIAFLILSWYAIVYIVVVSKNLIHFPFMFRIGSPFYYLVPPLIYLYIRCSFYKQQKRNRWDYLHLIPFLLTIIDISKYVFGMSAADKMAEIELIQIKQVRALDLGSGFVPAITHQYLRVIQSLVYLFFQWRMVVYFVLASKLKFSRQWIVVLSMAETLIYAGNLAITIAFFFEWQATRLPWLLVVAQLMGVLLVLGFSMVSYYLNFKPEFLYGRTLGGHHVLVEVKKELYVPQVDHCERLEAHLDSDLPYLIKRLTLNDIALAVKIPVQALSVLLNNHYKQNFNDFINNYRVMHVMERMKNDPTWIQLTMEGLAGESGFSSRTAFYAAFKKKTGLSPGAYAATLAEVKDDV